MNVAIRFNRRGRLGRILRVNRQREQRGQHNKQNRSNAFERSFRSNKKSETAGNHSLPHLGASHAGGSGNAPNENRDRSKHEENQHSRNRKHRKSLVFRTFPMHWAIIGPALWAETRIAEEQNRYRPIPLNCPCFRFLSTSGEKVRQNLT